MFVVIFIFILVYYIVTIFVPYYLYQTHGDEICRTGMPIESILIYTVFALITGLIEFVIFKNIADKVGDYLPNLINEDEYNEDEDNQGLVNKVKSGIKQNKWVTYFFQFFSS